jgi:hypothetical protein
MSQHHFTTNEGRDVLYGLDKPTGGYFFTEFYKDDEIDDGGEEVKNDGDALTLTELKNILKNDYQFDINPDEMVADWDRDLSPTPLQYKVNKMFDKDLEFSLNMVALDLAENYA